MRARCREWGGKPRAQIEGLVAERYGGLTEKQKQDAEEVTREPAKPPQLPAATGLGMNPRVTGRFGCRLAGGRDPRP